MGIRFECPNGHKLNVKAFLAGKRGICPHCDARFVVPEVSATVASSTEPSAPEELDAEDIQQTPIAAPPAPDAPPPPPGPSKQDLPDVWYVRLTDGGQYGPATSEIMNHWVAEGRVAEDSWVWRTGWPEWQTGAEVLPLFNHSPAPVETPPPPPAEVVGEQSHNVGTARFSRPTRRSRRDRARNLTLALGGLVFLLLVALVLVLAG